MERSKEILDTDEMEENKVYYLQIRGENRDSKKVRYYKRLAFRWKITAIIATMSLILISAFLLLGYSKLSKEYIDLYDAYLDNQFTYDYNISNEEYQKELNELVSVLMQLK